MSQNSTISLWFLKIKTKQTTRTVILKTTRRQTTIKQKSNRIQP